MRILIHNTKTGLYLAEGDQWVEKAADARDFQHALTAIQYATDHNLADVEMIFAFANQIYNFGTHIGSTRMARECS